MERYVVSCPFANRNKQTKKEKKNGVELHTINRAYILWEANFFDLNFNATILGFSKILRTK